MPKVWSTTKQRDPQSQQGFSIVEVLLAAAVFGLLTTGLIGAIVYGRASNASSGDTARAHMIAEEGIEATRNIAGSAYANLVDSTPSYGLALSGNQWTFSGTSDTTDIYTRKVVIATAGTNRKTATVTVTWPEVSGGTGSASLTTQLTNWQASLKSWSNAAVKGTSDVTGTNNGLKTATSGNYAFTVLNVATTNNFVVTNISNPATPTSTAFSIAGTPTSIAIYGSYAFVSNQLDTAELQVVNISNPAAPSVVASVNMTGTGNGQGVYIANGLAYVSRAADATTNAFELTIVNISNPTTPVVLGGYNNDISMNEVTVIGNNAFVATSSTTQEMLVINASVPAAPTLLATYNAPTAVAATSVTSYGTVALLGMGTTFSAINVATPASPVLFSSFTAAGTINDIAVDVTQSFAFLATASTTGEFQVVSISNPSSMTLTKTLDITGTTSTFSGVAYSQVYDMVIAASAADTQEVQVLGRT